MTDLLCLHEVSVIPVPIFRLPTYYAELNEIWCMDRIQKF
jgi:hypothetical protein